MSVASLCREIHKSTDEVRTGFFTYIYCSLKLQNASMSLEDFIESLKELGREDLELWLTDVLNRINRKKYGGGQIE